MVYGGAPSKPPIKAALTLAELGIDKKSAAKARPQCGLQKTKPALGREPFPIVLAAGHRPNKPSLKPLYAAQPLTCVQKTRVSRPSGAVPTQAPETLPPRLDPSHQQKDHDNQDYKTAAAIAVWGRIPSGESATESAERENDQNN